MNIEDLAESVEQVSQIYAEKYDIQRDSTWFLLKLQEEVGELTQAYLMLTGQARAKGKTTDELQAQFSAELADVLCQALLLARFHNVDLAQAINDKWLWRLSTSLGKDEIPPTC